MELGDSSLKMNLVSPETNLSIKPSDELTRTYEQVMENELNRVNPILKGHTKEVIGAYLTNDNSFVISAGKDNTVRVWSLIDRGKEQIYEVLANSEEILTGMALSSDDKFIVFTVMEKDVVVWSLETKNEMVRVPADDEVSISFVTISSDNSTFLVVENEIQIKVYDFAGNMVKSFDPEESKINCINFVNKTVFIGYCSSIILGRNIETNNIEYTLDNERSFPISLLYYVGTDRSENGGLTKYLGAGYDDKDLVIWELKNEPSKYRIEIKYGKISSISYSCYDGKKTLVCIVDSNNLVFIDLVSKNITRYFTRHTEKINSVVQSKDGQLVITASADKLIKIWQKLEFRYQKASSLFSTQIKASSLYNESNLFAIAYETESVKVFNLAENKEVNCLNWKKKRVCAAIWSHDKKQIITANSSPQILVFSYEGKNVEYSIQLDAIITNIILSHDSMYLYGCNGGNNIYVCNLHEKRLDPIIETDTKHHVLAFNHDSTIMYSGDDSNIIVWNIATKEIKKRLKVNTSSVICLVLLANQKILISGGNDGKIEFLNLEQINFNLCIEEKNSTIRSMELFSNEKFLVVVYDSAKIKVVNVLEMKTEYEFNGPGGQFCCKMLNETTLIMGDNQFIRFMNLPEKKEEFSIKAHTDTICSILLDISKDTLISFSSDETIKSFKISNKSEQESYQTYYGSIISLSLSKEYLALATDLGLVFVYNTNSIVEIKKIHVHNSDIISIEYYDGKFATGSSDTRIGMFNTNDYKPFYFEGHTEKVRVVKFSNDGKLLFSGSDDKKIKAWNIEKKAIEYELEGHNSYISSLCVFTSQNLLASGSGNKSVKLWNLDLRKEKDSFENHSGSVLSLALSDDEQLIISGSDDLSIAVTSVEMRKLVCILTGHSNFVFDVKVYNNTLYSTDKNEVKTWLINEKKEDFTMKSKLDFPMHLVLSPDGKYLAASFNEGFVRIYDIKNSKFLETFQPFTSENAPRIEFTADSNNVIIASPAPEYDIIIWDIENKKRREITGNKPRAKNLKFSADHERLAIFSKENQVCIWSRDCISKKFMFEYNLEKLSANIQALVFSNDRKYLFIGGEDNLIIKYDLSSKDRKREKEKEMESKRESERKEREEYERNIEKEKEKKKEKRREEVRKNKERQLKERQEAKAKRLKEKTKNLKTKFEFKSKKYIFGGEEDEEKKLERKMKLKEKEKIFKEKIEFEEKEIERTEREQDEEEEKYRQEQENEEKKEEEKEREEKEKKEKEREEREEREEKEEKERAEKEEKEKGIEKFIYREHTSAVRCLALANQKNILISGGHDKKICFFDTTNNQIKNSQDNKGSIWTIDITPDEKYAITGGEEVGLKVWDIDTSKLIYNFENYTAFVYSIVISKESDKVYSGAGDKTIWAWNFSQELEPTLSLCQDYSVPLSLGQKDSTPLGSCQKDSIPLSLPKSRPTCLRSACGIIYCITLDKEGKDAYLGTDENNINIFDIKTKTLRDCLTGHTKAVCDIVLSEDDSILVSGSWDTTVRVYDTKTLKELALFKEHKDYVRSVAITKDKKYIISGSDDFIIILWNLERKERESILEGHRSYVYCVRMTLDEKYLISASRDQTIKIWDWNKKIENYTFSGQATSVKCLALMDNSNNFLSGGENGLIKSWSILDQREEYTLDGHTASINSMKLTSDNLRLISGSDDCKVLIWDLEQRTIELSLGGYLSGVLAVNIDCKGSSLLTSSNDKVFKVWKMTELIQEKFQTSILEPFIKISTDDKKFELRYLYGRLNEVVKVNSNSNKLELGITDTCDPYYQNLIHFYNLIDNIIGNQYDTLLPDMSSLVFSRFSYTTIHILAYLGYPKVIIELLDDNASIKTDYFGKSPLYYAINKSNQDCVDNILEFLVRQSESNDKTRIHTSFGAIANDLPIIIKNSSKNLHLLLKSCLIPTDTTFAKVNQELPIYKFNQNFIPFTNDFIQENSKSNELIPVIMKYTPFTLPCKMGTDECINFLKSIIDCSNTSIYNTHFIQYVLQIQWDNLQMWVLGYTFMLWLNLVLLVVLFTIDKIGETWVLPIFLLSNFMLMTWESIQMIEEGLIEYFKDSWNIIDFFRFSLTMLWVVWNVLELEKNLEYRILAWLVALLNFTRGLTGFRVFDGTRYYVRLILRALGDMGYFFIMLGYSTITFGVMFQVSRHGNSFDFKTLWMDSYSLNFGNFEAQDEYQFSFETLAYMLATIVNVILMLNLLISILGDSYSNFQNDKVFIDFKEKASVILEIQKMFFWVGNVTEKKYFHVLCSSTDAGEDETIDERVAIIETSLECLSEKLTIHSKLVNEKFSDKLLLMENKFHDQIEQVKTMSKSQFDELKERSKQQFDELNETSKQILEFIKPKVAVKK